MKKLNAQQRDEFLDRAAMMAMQGFIINGEYRHNMIASVAYEGAEALLAERDRRTEEK